jgi:hypothetical protein
MSMAILGANTMKYLHAHRSTSGMALFRLVTLFVLLLGIGNAWAVTGVDYGSDDRFPMRGGETQAEWIKRVLPEGAELIHDPVIVDFGADTNGTLLVFQQYHPDRQVWIWYLIPSTTQKEYLKVIVKSPEPLDEYFDLVVNRIFSLGPEGAKDLVLLETFSRPAIAGGEVHVGGSVYRRIQLHAQYLEDASEALNGVTTEAEARVQLAPWIPRIPPAKPGSLVEDFLSTPRKYLPATQLERWELIKPDSPRLMVMDTKNGFVRIAADGGLPGYELGRFSSRQDGPVFALQTQWTQGQHTVFLRRHEGRWVDISNDILPDYQADKAYKIPHFGRDLILYGENGQVDRSYRWNGHHFEAIQPATPSQPASSD